VKFFSGDTKGQHGYAEASVLNTLNTLQLVCQAVLEKAVKIKKGHNKVHMSKHAFILYAITGIIV
jgi:hypothetical protein